MVVKKKAKENKGAVKTETAATAAVPVVATPAEFDRAEKLLGRLETLQADSEKTETAIGKLMGALTEFYLHAMNGGQLTAKNPQYPVSDMRNKLMDVFKHLDAREILACLLFEEILISSKPAYDEVRGLAVDRIRKLFDSGKLEKPEYDDLYGILMVLRVCRLGKAKCRLW